MKKSGKKGKDEKEDKTLKREKPPHLVRGFSWVIFDYKTGEKLKIRPFFGPLIEVMAIHIYIYIYISLSLSLSLWVSIVVMAAAACTANSRPLLLQSSLPGHPQ